MDDKRIAEIQRRLIYMMGHHVRSHEARCYIEDVPELLSEVERLVAEKARLRELCLTAWAHDDPKAVLYLNMCRMGFGPNPLFMDATHGTGRKP